MKKKDIDTLSSIPLEDSELFENEQETKFHN